MIESEKKCSWDPVIIIHILIKNLGLKWRLNQIKLIKSGKKNSLELGDLNVKRDFIHINDVSNTIKDIILDNNIFGKIINIASGKSITPKYIAKKILLKKGLNCKIISLNSKKRKNENANEKVKISKKINHFNKMIDNLL